MFYSINVINLSQNADLLKQVYCKESIATSLLAYIYRINLQTAAVSLFESSSAQLRSNEDLEGAQNTIRAVGSNPTQANFL